MTGTASRFRGTHTTTYAYSEPVFLNSHTIRLRPRPDPGQLVHNFEIDIDPIPDGTTSALDAWGNSVVWAWFSGYHQRLEIVSRFDVERVRTNPYDFVVTSQEAARIPPTYAPEERAALVPYLDPGEPGAAVRELAESAAHDAGQDVLAFAGALAMRIQERCVMIVRPEGEPHPGERTLDEGQGSCRDFAVLYVEACRYMGIASRFVSGYVEQKSLNDTRELHAWSGVYVPGGGWRGFDSTQGLAVSTGHITLAVAGLPMGAAPVTGAFSSGNGATSTLTSTIDFDVSRK